MSDSPLSFSYTTFSGDIVQISPSYSTYNPFTGNSSSGNWYYYLINYGSYSNVYSYTVTVNNLSVPLNSVLIASGGSAGNNGTFTSNTQPGFGGGGAGGQVLTLTYSTPNTNDNLIFTLSEINSSSSPTTFCYAIYNINGNSPSYSIINGLPGSNGSDTTSSSAGNGGNGGNGGSENFISGVTSQNITSNLYGGAGGNGGNGGWFDTYIYDYGTMEKIITYGSNGTPGTSYFGATSASVGDNNNSPPGNCNITFADGQSADVASGGYQNTSGNSSCFMIYYNLDA